MVSVLIAAIVCLAPPTFDPGQVAPGTPAKPTKRVTFDFQLLDHEVFRGIQGISKMEEFSALVNALRAMPDHARVSLAVHLTSWIDARSDDRDKIERNPFGAEYIWKPGTHDLNRLSGRAAHIIEQVTGGTLPRITPDSTI